MYPAPAAPHITLTEHSRRRQAEVDADHNRGAIQHLDGLLRNVQVVAKLGIDRTPLTNESVLAVDVNRDPLIVLAGLQPIIVTIGQILEVLRIRPPATWLPEQTPAIGGYFLEQPIPPVVAVWWVGVHDDPEPGRPAFALGWVAADTTLQHINHCPRYFPGLVDPGAGQLERQ